jgi:phosphoribosylamine--glycine ligase
VGPTRDAAQLEASKSRGKQFCLDHGLPTAAHREFTAPEAAIDYIRELPYACVVKEDGLTPDGDGAVVCDTTTGAVAAVRSFVRPAGDFRVVVEERLHGPEISIFALLDGQHHLLFPTGLDYKRALEGDEGGNCDGMGSISPHPLETDSLRAEIRRVLLDPLVRGLRAEGLDYRGFVFLGAMLTERGLQVLEINTRFGDSEAEAILPGVVTSLTGLFRAVLAGDLDHQRLQTDGLVRCSIALTQGSVGQGDAEAPGWPFGRYRTGQPVTGLADVDRSRATVFLANIHRDAAGRPVTAGGRVLHVVGDGQDLAEARDNAYSQIERIDFPGMRVRADIGDLTPRTAGPAVTPTQAQPQPEVARG